MQADDRALLKQLMDDDKIVQGYYTEVGQYLRWFIFTEKPDNAQPAN